MARQGNPNDGKHNSHGYSDPTASAVFRNADAEEARFRKLLKAIFTLCELSGFELTERITLTDKRTGRVWK